MAKAMKRAVALFRISVEKHKKKKDNKYVPHGLGIEAQEVEVKEFGKQYHYRIEKSFHELISGLKKVRPMLNEVLEYCRTNGCILIVAKLDRLTRRVAFIATLMESDIEFRIVEYGDPREIKGRVYWDAVQAELEVDAIKKRTKAALRAKLARGEKMGQFGKNILSRRNHRKSVRFSLSKERILTKLINVEGITSYNGLAKALNRLGVKTYYDLSWSAKTVRHVIQVIARETGRKLIKSKKRIKLKTRKK